MVQYIAQRLFESLIVLLVMSFVIYCLIGLMPGDPIDAMLASNPGFTAEDAARLRALYGLDQPLVTRYWHWLSAAVTLDFGYSRIHQVPVFDVVLPALGHTVRLMAFAFTIASTLAISLGVTAALNQRRWPEAVINFVAFAGISVPSFWFALMLIIIFAVKLGWLPASGMSTIGEAESFADMLKYMVLPVVTLSIAYNGSLTRYTRAAMIETLRMDYIRTARAKGLGTVAIIRRHALPNAMIPVVTVMALSFGGLMSGALITETMFAQRGMGKLIFDSVIGNDFNVALIALLFATLVTLMANLAADLLYAWLDPRISLK